MEKSNIIEQVKNLASKISKYNRYLTSDEIKSLITQNNICENWERIRVASDFHSGNIQNSIFKGDIYLPKFTSAANNEMAGIYNCFVENSILENSLLRNNQKIEHCFIGENSVITGCGILKGSGNLPACLFTPIHPGTELESRNVWLKEGLTIENVMEMAQLSGDFQKEYGQNHISTLENVKSSYMYIGSRVEMTAVGEVYNSFIASHCKIRFASRIVDSVILALEKAPTLIGNCQLVQNSFVEPGCKVQNGAILKSSLLMEYSEADEHVIINQSVIGPNNHCAKGEITACIFGPFVGFHHQSLLISVIWPEGKGNVGHGAKLGSNHTGRKPDQEFAPGEGMFFGLGCQIKFPGNFKNSPYSLIATGVLVPPQKTGCPFSLITQQENPPAGFSPSLNNIMPGWMWAANSYSLFRGLFKFNERNKSSHHIPDSLFAVSIAKSVLQAYLDLKNISEKKKFYTEEDIPCLGHNILSDLQRQKALESYSQYLYFYLLDSSVNSSVTEAFLSVSGLTSALKISDPAEYLTGSKNLLQGLKNSLLKGLIRDNQRGRAIFEDYDKFHLKENEIEEKDSVVIKFKDLCSKWENYLIRLQ